MYMVFLIKPVSYDAFRSKLIKLLTLIKETKVCVSIKGAAKERQVLASNILYVQANGRYTAIRVCGEDAMYFDEGSISCWEDRLALYGFVRCHKSYLVNLSKIRAMEEDLLLEGGIRIPISRRERKMLKEEYEAFMVRMAKAEGQKYV